MLLDLCAATSGGQSRQALVESALLHLAVALRLYIRELGHNRAVTLPERLYRVEDLKLETDGGVCVDELAEKAFVAAIESAERYVLSPAVGAVQLINSSSRDETSDLDCQVVQRWLSSLQELVERQRQSFLEY